MLAPEVVKEMKEYGNAGFSYKEIAAALNVDPRTVSNYLGKKNSRITVTDEVYRRMCELRDHGLSNSQIAIEMHISESTVTTHLGPTKKRAEYGSLVSHATGDTFVKEEKRANEMQRKLKVVNTSISCDGKDFYYKASTDGRVRISSATGFAVDLDKDQFLNFIAELCEVGDWLAKNTNDGTVCYLDS